jgi:hypothetical protein
MGALLFMAGMRNSAVVRSTCSIIGGCESNAKVLESSGSQKLGMSESITCISLDANRRDG